MAVQCFCTAIVFIVKKNCVLHVLDMQDTTKYFRKKWTQVSYAFSAKEGDAAASSVPE